jgi:tetratricopeptide (TPR) repeat protein
MDYLRTSNQTYVLTMKKTLSIILFAILAVPQLAVAQTVDQLMQKANAASRAGHYSEAENLWKQVIQKSPTDVTAYLSLGYLFLEEQKFDDSISVYRKAITLNKNPKRLWLSYWWLGIALKARGNKEESKVVQNKSIQIITQLLSSKNDVDELPLLEHFLREENRLIEIVPLYQTAIRKMPNKNAHIYGKYCGILREFKKLDEALPICRRSIALHLKDVDGFGAPIANAASAYHEMGKVLRDKGDTKAALAAYRQALAGELDPGESGLFDDIEVIYRNQNKLPDVINFYQAVTSNSSDKSYSINCRIGKIWKDLAQWDNAATAYRLAIQADPEMYFAYYQLGLVYAAQQQWDAAIVSYREALRRDDVISDSCSKSTISCSRWYWKGYSPALNHLALGKAYQAKGMASEAIKEYRLAVALDPMLEEAKQLLGKLR